MKSVVLNKHGVRYKRLNNVESKRFLVGMDRRGATRYLTSPGREWHWIFVSARIDACILSNIYKCLVMAREDFIEQYHSQMVIWNRYLTSPFSSHAWMKIHLGLIKGRIRLKTSGQHYIKALPEATTINIPSVLPSLSLEIWTRW